MQIVVHDVHNYKRETNLDSDVGVEINSISNPKSFDHYK